MKTNLLLFLLTLMVFSGQLSAQTANEEHSSYYEAGKVYYDNEDYANAFEQFRQGAELSYADAQALLGYCYAMGKGVNKDLEKAVYWYQKSAEQEHALGQCYLGICYYNGLGVAKDLEKAFSLFKKSAEQENALGQYYLSHCYLNGVGVDKDIVQGLRWVEKAANQGLAYAQYVLGYCYYEGIGVPQNYKSAFYWFKQAAEQGDGLSQYYVGCCYLYGDGIEEDEQLAVNWLKQAAEQGDSDALYLLGICYSNGDGVAEDLNEAKSWFEKAAAQGNEKAKTALAELKKPAASQSAPKNSQPETAADDDDAPKPTAAELAALKKFKASMAGHTYQCNNFSFNDPTLNYIMTAGGMQIVASITFISKTQARVKATFKLNSSAAQRSPTAYQMKESIERIMNYTGTIYTWGPYLAFKNPNGNSDYMVKPREGTLKLVDEYGNVFKKVK